MSLAIAASSAPVPQQKPQLPNPFQLQDIEILHKVYLTHFNDDELCDKTTLFNLVSNTISASASTVLLNGQSLTSGTSFKPDFPALKRISCQMITTRGSAQCAHQSTIWILEQLRSYSWDAKALITLAAFALEYGEFLLLLRIPNASDQLGSALKQLNQVQARNVPPEIRELVGSLMEAYQSIKEWAMWSATGYDPDEVDSLSDVIQEIPLVVYWIIASIVASSAKLVGINSEYKLSDFEDRLSKTANKLKLHLEKCRVQIRRKDDQEKVMQANVKDVVGLLKILIEGIGSEIAKLSKLYEGGIQIKNGVEVFKGKYVMLFLSSLDSIGDEILLLNSIHRRLEEKKSEEVKGFKKGDFKILWIPIVETWNSVQKELFITLKKEMKWNVLEYFSELPGIGIIRKKFKYYKESKPIVAVINPQGQVMNVNALPIIFQWGIEAFPFREEDADDLVKKWTWFWNLMKRVDLNIEYMGKDSYIFIYGGNDSKWIREFTVAIGKIKKNERIKNVDVNVENYQLGKDSVDKVPYFWIGIDGKKQNKACKDKVDCEIQELVKSLLCLKQDPQGWVILSKGSNIKILGHGEPMYQTVADFEVWKDKVLEKEGFDVAFKEYYDVKLKEMSARCALVSNASSVVATITCPNPTCGRVMEVTSVNYRCCHRDDPNCCSV